MNWLLEHVWQAFAHVWSAIVTGTWGGVYMMDIGIVLLIAIVTIFVLAMISRGR